MPFDIDSGPSIMSRAASIFATPVPVLWTGNSVPLWMLLLLALLPPAAVRHSPAEAEEAGARLPGLPQLLTRNPRPQHKRTAPPDLAGQSFALGGAPGGYLRRRLPAPMRPAAWDGGFASGDGGVGRVYTRAGIPVLRPEGAQTMSFQQKMYVVFWVAVAMFATASVIVFLKGGEVDNWTYLLIMAAILPLIAGLPAFINQHLHIWDDKDDNEK